jgi:hypothetical protein
MAFQFELRGSFGLINNNFCNQWVIIIILMFSIRIEDLHKWVMYSIWFVIIFVDFAWTFYVMSLFSVCILLGLVIVKSMRIFGPRRNVDLDTT